MLLSVDRPSPGAAAATVVLVAGADEAVAVVAAVVEVAPAVVGSAADVSEDSDDEGEVPLAGEMPMVRVKPAVEVDDAETAGRVQVVEVEVQSADWAAAAASGIGLVFWASAVVVAPRAARMWEARIGFGGIQLRRRVGDDDVSRVIDFGASVVVLVDLWRR